MHGGYVWTCWKLEEAYDIIRSIPTEPNSVILRSFISACKHHGHIPCAEENIREILLKIGPGLGSNYVLASSLSYLLVIAAMQTT